MSTTPGLDVDLDGVRSWETAGGFWTAAPTPSAASGSAASRSASPTAGCASPPASGPARSPWTSPPATLPSLFSCDPAALAELRLRSYAVLAPPVGSPGSTPWPRSPSTGSSSPPNGWRQVEAMIAAAPGLRELTLKDIVFRVADGSIPGKWVIGGPSLRRLVVCLRLAGAGSWELGELPKLERASVSLNDYPADRDYVRLLIVLSSVRELKLVNFGGATHHEPILASLSHRSQNLRVLKLDTNFHVVSTLISTFFMLHQAPLLQVLEITDLFRDGEMDEFDVVSFFMDGTSFLRNFALLHNLEYLYMIGISCSATDMHFVKHIIQSARNLRVVSVDKFEGSRKSAQEASRELKECHRVYSSSKDQH
ncbi:hypothetical protein C2845_PM04G05700 [Panicum miliaceum]|uniref:FBD domain-containing protein n=1 Tax=Panicum miliaceum TaxID=4540 RepID=A0A3L6QMI6_PANMI|nr:hypothetical protein C2845_PM04G05700 [Panicum miliaceum]